MSLSVVRQVLLRLGTDPSFRKNFFDLRSKALESYDLTDEERQSLCEIENEDRLAAMCEQADRISQVHVADIRI